MTQAGEQNKIKEKYIKPINNQTKKIEIMVIDTQKVFPTKWPKRRGRR